MSIDNSEVLKEGDLDLVSNSRGSRDHVGCGATVSNIRASRDHAGCGAIASQAGFTKVAVSHPGQEIVENFDLKHIEFCLKKI